MTPENASRINSYFIESLGRGLKVLSLFSTESPTLSLNDVTQRLQLNKTTAYRLLYTLENLGYIRRDAETRRYQPTLEILRLGFVVLNQLEVRQIAAPYLRQLVDDVQETVNLAVLDQHEVVYIDRVGSKHMVNVYRPIGSRLPAYCTSTGKVLLAFSPPEIVERAIEATSWQQLTERTIVSPEAFRKNLALIRRRGFADSYGEMIPELSAVSAPIFQNNGQVIAAVNISVPTHRTTYERLVNELGPRVVKTAQQISQAFGYHSDVTAQAKRKIR
ncbi:MAG: IclR family transcriptional regulator [Chloroflexi bacterium]|nr:MAG: IclR family transcriptional regulator [Chloroflexota bacterium]